MIKQVSRLIKSGLVRSRLDNILGDIHYRTGWKVFRKLIPDRSFYSAGDRKVLKRYGVEFEIRPADFTQWLIFSDEIDRHIAAAKTVLGDTRGGIILDIGANCGNFSLLMASEIVARGWANRIYAFEPNPIVFNYLVNNITRNSFLQSVIETKNVGVGEFKSTLTLHMPQRNSGAGSLVRNYKNEPHLSFDVDIVAIDDMFIDRDVEFIKIDVENFELSVLKGARETINKWRPAVFIEIGGNDVGNKKLIEDFFVSQEYIFFFHDGRRFVNVGGIVEAEGVKDIFAIYRNWNAMDRFNRNNR